MRISTDTANVCGKKGTDFYLIFEVNLKSGQSIVCSKMLDIVIALEKSRTAELEAVQTAMALGTYARAYDKLETEHDVLVNQVFALRSLKTDMLRLIDKEGV